ncbi:hypothetical protein PRZ48_010058 [Zasmidium cellare]|uniref:FAD dependent oxidoreductase domain-containing protein n=1 Tax=Zasmidium cellare TaxID=395010 RepID=A0ABR0EDJ2_ZASCE|nr:hypothetical protein PRZ48_010058 [Zasmidium cellare]
MAPHATSEEAPKTLPERPQASQANTSNGHRSLPTPNPCLSYWHRTTRAWQYLDHNSSSSVPPSTKYCIIGSGLAGSLTAWSLVESGLSPKDILILEAREAVSGASGRNAGHVRPDAFRGFAAYERIHGTEQAKKIVENEKVVFEEVDAFVKKHNVPCDFNSTTTFDVCLTEEFAAYERESLEKYRAAGGDVAHVKVWEDEDAKRKTQVKDALLAYEWPAGSSHPAKLAQWILTKLVEDGVGLWTHCPATEVIRSGAGPDYAAEWDVQTPRGTVSAEKVVHCTNAYASYLLPELASFVTPNRAQAHSFIPSRSLSGLNAMKSTMSLRYSLKHFFSFIQRLGDGTVVFGTSRENPDWSQTTKDSLVTFDDTLYSQEAANSAVMAFRKLFPEDDVKVLRHGEGADHYWTGIIGMTPDSVPMIGPVDGKEGQYICAGFNGHGMARIWTCAPGLVKIMLGGEWSSTGLPECFQYSKARLERAAKQEVKSVW